MYGESRVGERGQEGVWLEGEGMHCWNLTEACGQGIGGKLWLHKRSSSGVGIVIRLHSLVFWMGWEGRNHE
jgi:hypothetical protein